MYAVCCFIKGGVRLSTQWPIDSGSLEQCNTKELTGFVTRIRNRCVFGMQSSIGFRHIVGINELIGIAVELP